jgi:hypothetical protein
MSWGTVYHVDGPERKKTKEEGRIIVFVFRPSSFVGGSPGHPLL